MAVTLDIGLIVVACIIPFVLIFFNLVVMAHYIDPQAAAGHFAAAAGLLEKGAWDRVSVYALSAKAAQLPRMQVMWNEAMGLLRAEVEKSAREAGGGVK